MSSAGVDKGGRVAKYKMGKTARWNPKKRLPPSPIKNLAGRELKCRKPVSVPANKILSRHNCGRCVIAPNKAAPNTRISIVPPARPSMPSIRLTAFTMPRNQIKKPMPITRDGRCNGREKNAISVMVFPITHQIAPAVITCALSFTCQANILASSMVPSTNSKRPPKKYQAKDIPSVSHNANTK